MAEKQSYEDKMREALRESLGEIDEIAQVTLKSHILIEAQLVDILVLLVDGIFGKGESAILSEGKPVESNHFP